MIMNFLNFKFNADSVLFELPIHFSGTVEIQNILSNKVIYLMNKLFAVSGSSPFWSDKFRYLSSGIKWNLSLHSQYSDDRKFSSDLYEMICAGCGGSLAHSDYTWTDDWGETFCENCHFYCESCDHTYSGTPNYIDGYHSALCDYCYEENFFECEVCHEMKDKYYMSDVEDVCEDCVSEYACACCNEFDVQVQEVTMLDDYDHDTYLSDCVEKLCPDCIKRFLDAGYEVQMSSEGLVLASSIKEVMDSPFEELLDIELLDTISYSNIPAMKGNQIQGVCKHG